MPARILVVEDRESLRGMLERALRGEGHEVSAVADGESVTELLVDESFDLVLTDLKLPGISGLEVVARVRSSSPQVPVVVLTAYGTVAAAVEAMKRGAVDFLEKPVELDELFALVSNLVEADAGGVDALFEAPGCAPIVGSHPRLKAALRLAERVAGTDATVLLTGESGTGKELFARAIHSLSGRADGPFVAVNCAAIPVTLVENELFGHEKGAFTGASSARPGRFERAEGGTLFLDEIGELPLEVQGKILRVIEERVYERVGGGELREADVRLVTATNRDLEEMVRNGDFRSDLYYRLDVFPIHLPPLRERPDDVPDLVSHLLDSIGERHGLDLPRPTSEAIDLLTRQPWPGNVRQLANVLERAVILHHGERLTASRVAELVRRLDASEEDERREIRAALEEVDGDKRRAAELLGISYRTLQRRIRSYDLEGYPRYRS